MPSLAELRNRLPQIRELDDGDALTFIQRAYYPGRTVDEVGAALGVQPPAPPVPRRNFGAVANDTVIEVANAAAGGLGAAADFVAPGNALSRGINDFVKGGEASQSDAVQAEKQRFAQEVDQAEGVGGELGAVGGYVLRNPLIAAAQAAGSFVGPGMAIKGAQGLARAAGAGVQLVGRAGLAGGALAGSAMAGGDAAGQAYELAKQAGASEEDAVAAARQASLIPAAIGGVGGLVGAERVFAGAGGFAGGAVARAAKTGLVEGLQEGFEEGVTNYEGRRAAQPFDPKIDPMKGTAAAAGMGFALGGATGAAVGAMSPAAEVQKAQATQRLAMADNVADMISAANDLAAAPLDIVRPEPAVELDAFGDPVATSEPAQSFDEGSAVLADPGTNERRDALINTLQDRGNLEQIREKLGDEAVGTIAYYAQQANRTDIPPATAERMLELAEMIVSRALARPITGAPQAAQEPMQAIEARQQGLIGMESGPARIEQDVSRTGTIRVDAAGNASPETRADQINSNQAQQLEAEALAAAQAEREMLGQQARKASAVNADPNPRRPAPPVNMPERRRTDAVEMTPPDPVAAYISDIRKTNTPAARAFIQDLNAGRITRQDIVRVMQTQAADPLAGIQQGQAADPVQQRIERAAAQAPAPAVGIVPARVYRSRSAAFVEARKTGGTVQPAEGGFIVSTGEANAQPDVAVPAGLPAEAGDVQAAGLSEIDAAANEAATSPANARPEPTQAQKEAGNYAKGHVRVAGLDITVENPQGSTRSGVDTDGKAWTNTLQHHYGYVKRSTGADGEQVDVFVKPGTAADYAGQVFVVDQIDPSTGKFDEHKAMIGFDSEQEAREAYQANYAKGWKGLKSVKAMTADQFKTWVRDGTKTAKPATPASRTGKKPAIDEERDTMLQALAKAGGLNRVEAAREFGLKPEELKATVRAGNLRAYPFRNTGLSVDRAIEALQQYGYFDGVADEDMRATFEAAIFDELGGNGRLSTRGQMRQAEERGAVEAAEQQAAAEAELTAAEEAERAAIIAEWGGTGDVSRLSDDDIPDLHAAGSSDKAELMRALGFTEQEIADELQAEQAARQGGKAEVGQRSGEDAGAQARALDRTGSEEARDLPAADQGLTLETQTAEDLRKKTASEQRAAAADAAEQKRLADKAKADAQRDEFTLTGSDSAADVAAAAGQGGLFDAPAPTSAAQGDARRLGREAGERGDPRLPPSELGNFERQVWRAGWDESKSTKVTPQVPVAAPAKADRLTDAGEELIRNRRGKLKGLAWDDVSGMNDTLKVAQVVKTNVWPRPDYAKMVEDGAPAWKAAVLKSIYDKIAVAPVTRATPTDADLRAYIETLQQVRETLAAELDRVEQLGGAGDLWKTLKAANVFGKVFPIPTDARPMFGSPSPFDRVSEKGKENNRRALMIGGNGTIQALQFDNRVLSKVKDLLADGFPAKQEAWQKSYEVRATETRDNDVPEAERTGETQLRFYVYEKGSRWRLAKGGQDGGYATQELAEGFARSLVVRKRETLPPSRGLDLSAATRVGPDWRNGKDVTADEVMKHFGFRGVNLGEYVKAKQGMAQLHLNHAYDAFSDLADLLGVPPKAMSLDGTLGLAIGAQGSGKALAHFVPGVNEINITRDSGAGALAHEFGHAVDHYFATQHGRAASMAKRPYLSAVVESVGAAGGVRPEVLDAMRTVMKTINARPMTEAEARKYLEDQRGLNQRRLDRWVAEFKGNRGADAAALDAVAQKLRRGDVGEAQDTDLETNLAEFMRASGLKPGNAIGANAITVAYRLRDLADEAKFMASHLPQVATDYAKASDAMDAKKQGDGYWSTPWEKFARAFETFAMDALKDRQRESLYLSGLVDSEGWRSWAAESGKAIPYPAGAERLQMQQAFQKLVDTIRTRETDRGTAIFSRTGETKTKRADEVIGRRSVGLPKVIADHLAAAYEAGGVQRVNVARNIDELPSDLRKKLSAYGDDVRGAYFPREDEIWVFSDKVNTPEELHFVVLHEAFHRGLGHIFGDNSKRLLRQMYATNKKLRDRADMVARELKIGKDESIEEALADMAGEGQAQSLRGWAKLAAMIRNWLNKLTTRAGLSLQFTNARIESFVSAVARAGITIDPDTGSRADGFDPDGVRVFTDGDAAEVNGSRGTNGAVNPLSAAAQQIANAIQETKRTDPFAEFALRVIPGEFDGAIQPGDVLPPSRVWDNGDMTDEELDGTSAIELRSGDERDVLDAIKLLGADGNPKAFSFYFGDRVVLVKGERIGPGEDIGEVLIGDAEVVGVWRKSGKGKESILPNEQSSPGSSGVRASRAASFAQSVNQQSIRNAVFDRLSSAGEKVSWWDKTIGTQYAKAMKHEEFKPVFEAVQGYIEDTSAFANEAADMAPSILPKLESLRDVFAAGKRGLSTEDAMALAAPIFEGTLNFGRQGGKLVDFDTLAAQAEAMTTEQKERRLLADRLVSESELKRWKATPLDIYDGAIRNRYEQEYLQPGVVFTRQELRDRFKLSEPQIEQYEEFRAAVNESLDQVVASDILRLLGDVPPDLKRKAMENRSELRGAVEQFLQSKADAEPDAEARGQIAATWNDIADKYAKVDRLKARGYAPLMRFGKFLVSVKGADGEQEFFGLYETRAEANKMARELGADPEFAGRVKQGVISQEAYKLFSGVPVDSLEMFADALGTEKSAVFQEWLRLTKNNRSALKRLIKRKGTAGFSDDVSRVLASFVTSNARMAAGALNMPQAKELSDGIASGDLKDEAIKLVEAVQNPTETAGALRGLMFVNFIGGSIASALVNTTQPLMMTLPYLSQFGGATKAAGRLLASARMAAGGTIADKEMAAALKRGEQDGIVSPQEIHHLTAEAMSTFSKHPVLKRAAFLWGAPFSLAEQFNRRITFLAAYQTAKAEGMRDPFEFAKQAITETQGLYNKGNAPNLTRNAIGATALTFKQYSVHYLEWLGRMWNAGEPGSRERAEGRKAVLLAMALLLAAGGTEGLPFAEDMNDLFDTFMQSAGFDTSAKGWKREFLANTLGLGDMTADVAQRGLSALPGIPLDVSIRMGMGNLIPGTGMLLKSNTDVSRDVLELAGPAGGLINQAKEAGRKALDGEIGAATAAMLPVAMQNIGKAASMWMNGEARDAKGRRVMETDEVDALMKLLGFQPAEVARESATLGREQRRIQLARNVETQIADLWAQGVRERDPDMVAEARQQLREWNEVNPRSRIDINSTQIKSRVKAMQSDRVERFERSAPKQLRSSVAEALQ